MDKHKVNAAYHNMAVHPNNRLLLSSDGAGFAHCMDAQITKLSYPGMKRRGHYFVGFALPSSLRSGPFISISVADMVESNLLNKYNLSDFMQ